MILLFRALREKAANLSSPHAEIAPKNHESTIYTPRSTVFNLQSITLTTYCAKYHPPSCSNAHSHAFLPIYSRTCLQHTLADILPSSTYPFDHQERNCPGPTAPELPVTALHKKGNRQQVEKTFHHSYQLLKATSAKLVQRIHTQNRQSVYKIDADLSTTSLFLSTYVLVHTPPAGCLHFQQAGRQANQMVLGKLKFRPPPLYYLVLHTSAVYVDMYYA